MSRVHADDGLNLAEIDLKDTPAASDDDSSHGSLNNTSADANRSPGPESRTCNVGRWVVRCALLAIVLVGASAGLLLMFRGTINPVDLFGHDKLPGVADVQRWETSGFNGLSLTIENALEDKWTPYFTKYVAEWDNGSPDALTLTTTRVSVDSSCQAATGVLKVCNGNYGNTDWNGITLNVMQQNGYIISSVSKMNDYFLDGLSDADKSYTM